MAVLVCELSSGPVEFGLVSPVMSIGRSHMAAISIKNDRAISHVHCLIVRRSDTYYVRDYHSRNGTLLNGKRLEDREMLLHDGDRLVIGKTHATFLKGSGDRYALIKGLSDVLHREEKRQRDVRKADG